MLPATDLFGEYRKAEALLAAGDLRNAADMCKRILDVNPGFSYGHHLMSMLFRATGSYDKAAAFAEIAVRMAPDIATFHVQQGQMLLLAGKKEAAVKALNKAHALEPGNAMTLVLWADACMGQGEIGDALALLRRARAIADIPEVDEHEGICLEMQGDLDAAEKHFDRVIERRSDYDRGYIHKGKVLMQKGQLNAAEGCFAKAIRINPKAYDALHYMVIISDGQKQPALAVHYACLAIQARPKAGGEDYVLLGLALLSQDKHPEAEQAFRQACALSPGDVHALQLLIKALYRQRKHAEALTQVEIMLAAKRHDVTLRHMRAMLRGENVAAPPKQYAAGLFDSYAEHFEHHMHQLLYRAPAMLADALRALPQVEGRAEMSLLDLGCGTGLGAEALKDITRVRIGVDLSPGMLAQARRKQLYTELYPLDAIEYMLSAGRIFDLVIATDVLMYVGDAAPFIRAARNVLAAQGLLAFTIEKDQNGAPFQLHPSGRYTHAPEHVLAVARDGGYTLLAQEDIVLRMEGYMPVNGVLFVFQKAPMH